MAFYRAAGEMPAALHFNNVLREGKQWILSHSQRACVVWAYLFQDQVNARLKSLFIYFLTFMFWSCIFQFL